MKIPLLFLVFGNAMMKSFNILPMYSDDTQKCINHLLNLTVNHKDIIYVINTDIHVSYPAVYCNTNKMSDIFIRQIPSLYIIAGNLTEVFRRLYERSVLNSKGKYIIIMNVTSTDYIDIFKTYYLNQVIILNINGNVLCLLSECSSRLCYKEQAICENIKSTEDFFKIQSLFKHTKLDVTWSAYGPFVVDQTKGIHIEIINIIASNMNLETNYIKTPTFTNPFQIEPKFKENIYDLSSLPYTNETLQFDKTFMVTEDKPAYITPRILVSRTWQIFFIEYEVTIWCMFVLVIVSLCAVLKLYIALIPNRDKVSIFNIIFGILLEGSCLYRTNNISLKLLIFNYSLFSLLFTTVYRGKMFDIMKTELSSQMITTKEDMLKYELKMGLPGDTFLDLYKMSIDPVDIEMKKNGRYLNCFNFTECLNRVAFKGDILSQRLLKPVKWLIPQYYQDSSGKSLLNIIQRPDSIPHQFGMLFRKGYPLFEEFNKKIIILKEAGVVEYIEKKHEELYIKATTLAQLKDGIKYSSLNLHILQSTFVVYLIGIGFSLLVFFIEITFKEVTKAIK
ncbi:Ionotropic receptor 164 [Diabrotica virgifera virgifera]|nr:Ionotropic receptor 164 [Diabrotica virgifera virgifera]